MTKEQKKSISASIPESLSKEINEICKKRGIPKAAFVRKAVINEMDAGCNDPARALMLLDLQERVISLEKVIPEGEYQELLKSMDEITRLMS